MSMFGASSGGGFGGINGIASSLNNRFGKMAAPRGGFGASFNNAGTSPTTTTTPAPRPGLFSNWFADAQPTTTTAGGSSGSTGSIGSGGFAPNASGAATPSPLPAAHNYPTSTPQPHPTQPVFFGGGNSGPAPATGNGMNGPAYQQPQTSGFPTPQPWTPPTPAPLSAQGNGMAAGSVAGPYGAPDNPRPADIPGAISSGLNEMIGQSNPNDWVFGTKFLGSGMGYDPSKPEPTWDNKDHSSEWSDYNSKLYGTGYGHAGQEMTNQFEKYNPYSDQNAYYAFGNPTGMPAYTPPPAPRPQFDSNAYSAGIAANQKAAADSEAAARARQNAELAQYQPQYQQLQNAMAPVAQPVNQTATPTQNQVASSGYKYYGPGNPHNVGTPPSGIGGIASSLAGRSVAPGSYGW